MKKIFYLFACALLISCGDTSNGNEPNLPDEPDTPTKPTYTWAQINAKLQGGWSYNFPADTCIGIGTYYAKGDSVSHAYWYQDNNGNMIKGRDFGYMVGTWALDSINDSIFYLKCLYYEKTYNIDQQGTWNLVHDYKQQNIPWNDIWVFRIDSLMEKDKLMIELSWTGTRKNIPFENIIELRLIPFN